MSKSRWRKLRDNTVPVLLGTLIVALFYTTASIHGRMADMENRLGERMHRMERELSARITRLETLMEVHLEAHSGPARSAGDSGLGLRLVAPRNRVAAAAKPPSRPSRVTVLLGSQAPLIARGRTACLWRDP